MPKPLARQDIGGRKPLARRPIASDFRSPGFGEVWTFPAGSYSFQPNRAGKWKFVLWGRGGQGSIGTNAASGAYNDVVAYIPYGASIPIVSGNSSVTLPDGRVVTAGQASGATPGVATGGDNPIDGSATGAGGGDGGGAQGAGGGGAGAPGKLPFRGGDGGVSTASGLPSGGIGGGGGGLTGSSVAQGQGGTSLVLAFFVGE